MTLLRDILNDPNRRRITVTASVPVPPERAEENQNGNQANQNDNQAHQNENPPEIENIPVNPYPEFNELIRKGKKPKFGHFEILRHFMVS